MEEDQPAKPNEVREHLEAFIQSFVDPSRRDRWKLFMLEKQEKAAAELHKLPLDARRVRWLEGPERYYAAFSTYAGNRRGIYISFRSEPVWMLADNAACRSDSDFEDAILSIEPGRLAIYFSHDGVSALLTHDQAKC